MKMMKSLLAQRLFQPRNIYKCAPLSSLLIVLIFAVSTVQAQPANDLCDGAELIMTPSSPGTTTYSGSGSTMTATTTNAPPSCGAGVDNTTAGGIWYTFDGESSTLYSISTCDALTDFDTELSLHTLTGTGSCMDETFACEAGNDNASCNSGGDKSTLSFFTPSGFVATTYYIYVSGEGTATGTVQLSITQGPPLPVELISFTGSPEEKSNILSWKTASEFNTEKFTLERSSDGSSGWKEIGDTGSVGFSNELQYYEYEDFDPPPKSFYRLRSVDFDGQEDVSKIVFLERNTSGFDLIKLTPNPVRDIVTLSFSSKDNNTIAYSIIDMQGNVVRQWSSNVERGVHEETMDLNDLVSGVYFIQLNNGTETIFKRIVRL